MPGVDAARRLCFLIPTLLAGYSLAAALGDEPPAPVEIHKTAEPLKIDGVLDEPVWRETKPIAVEYIWGKVGQKAKTLPMWVKYAWDGDYLYIGYETFDENLIAVGNGKKEGPPGNQREGAEISHPTEKVDVVEFFVSFGDLRFFWELHHNAANQFNDIWIANMDDDWPIAKSAFTRFGIYFGFSETLPDDESAGVRLAMAARPKAKADGKPSTINDSSDKDTGYVGELRLPWIGLGAPFSAETSVEVPAKEPGGKKTSHHGPWKLAGQEMRILAVCQNGDLEDHYHHTSPTFPGSWFHKGAVHWPKYKLVEK